MLSCHRGAICRAAIVICFFAQARSAAVVADLGAAYYIPIVIVPAAVVAHVMTLGIVLRRA